MWFRQHKLSRLRAIAQKCQLQQIVRKKTIEWLGSDAPPRIYTVVWEISNSNWMSIASQSFHSLPANDVISLQTKQTDITDTTFSEEWSLWRVETGNWYLFLK